MDNYDSLTRTGPGTPMGELMRQYWIPAGLSSELVADGPPVRMKLLGEKMIAFRDSSGRVGVLDHRCPHRCASLFYGRNEENGLRCVYHGWKYDVDGRCLEQANVPPHQVFADKIRAKAYLATERNGMIWVFMGDRERAPALPPFEATLLPQDQVEYRFVQRRCNWLQAMDGDLDTSHVGLLHFGAARPSNDLDTESRNLVLNKAPDYKVNDTEFGLSYGAYRPAADGGTYWRTAHFLFPFWVMPPITSVEDNVLVRGWIPLDDEALRCLRWHRPQEPFPREPQPQAAAGWDADRPAPSQQLGLARPLSQCRGRGERLFHRPRRAARSELHRNRGHPRSGPVHHREHGADRRPLVRDLVAQRHRRGAGPALHAARRRGVPAREAPAGRRQSRALCRGARRLLHDAGHRRLACKTRRRPWSAAAAPPALLMEMKA